MHSEIPRETLHEILRKLTPAIGRVLAKRRKLYSCNANPVQGHGCEQCRIDREYNSHLEQVLDHDIVEAVVMRGCAVELELDEERKWGFLNIVMWHNGRLCLEPLDNNIGTTIIEPADLPALVAEAWTK